MTVGAGAVGPVNANDEKGGLEGEVIERRGRSE